jgi:hypothetical protein
MGAKGGDYRPHLYLSAKSHPPLWQYFSRLRNGRQTRPLLPPKAADPGPHDFSPANRHLLGDHEGATMAITDPLWPAPLRG